MAQIPEPVKVEIDLESRGFVEVFENIAKGFEDLQRTNRRLWFAQVLFGLYAIGDCLAYIL